MPLNPLLNILILYDQHASNINAVREYLEGFSKFSANRIFYAPATHGTSLEYDLMLFDVVVLHYSVRLSLDWQISKHYAEALIDFSGLKVLFIQDEYDATETARCWISTLGISIVFTCVPDQYIPVVYPPERFPNTKFIKTLTGWVPSHLEGKQHFKPLQEREFHISYRGRVLSAWYGDLGREKFVIGREMRRLCEERNLPVDIEWADDKRIYGDQWYEFLENGRATLGTESGANVFDDYGDIRRNIEAAQLLNPRISYEDLHKKYVDDYEGKVRMNQISPKIFESIALKTALVLFEGTYSDVVQPELHFIPLKKDFSNVDEVLAKLEDFTYLEALTERAYQDIIMSGKYNYRQFVQDFDSVVAEHVSIRKGTSGFILHESQLYKRQAQYVHAMETQAWHLYWKPRLKKRLGVIWQLGASGKKGLGLCKTGIKVYWSRIRQRA